MKNDTKSFLNEVKGQIKSKEAQEFVSTELDYHLKESKKMWIERGLNESLAEERAVKQMGNPIRIGQQLNKLHRPKVDWLMITLLIITMGLSFLPIFIEGFTFDSPIAIKKLLIVVIGIVTVVGTMFIDYRKLESFGWLFYSIGALILISIYSFSNTMIFGRPLIELEVLTIESLMAIPFFFLAWASFFNNNKIKIWQFAILLFVSILLFYFVTNLTSVYIYLFMIFSMIWWSKFNKKKIVYMHLVLGLTTLITSILLLPNIKQYQITRLLAFLNPKKYENHTIIQLKNMFENAGWFGRSSDTAFLQGAFTDFAFVSLTYYYGWLFASAIVIILFLFVVRIVLLITKIKDSYSKLLLIGVVAIYLVQLVTNIGMTFGWIPLMSMSLPFISYGLMPTLLNAFLIGVALSVYRRKNLVFIHNKKPESTLNE